MTDNQNIDLLPCPFCGGEAWVSNAQGGSDERSGYNITYTVACKECGMRLTKRSTSDDNGWCNEKPEPVKERVITAWNTRAPQWQTIETAPKKGDYFVYQPEYTNGRTPLSPRMVKFSDRGRRPSSHWMFEPQPPRETTP